MVGEDGKSRRGWEKGRVERIGGDENNEEPENPRRDDDR